MTRSNRRAGADYEYEIVQELPDDEAERNIEDIQRGDEFFDVHTDLPLMIQAKYGKQPSVHSAIDEACKAVEVTDTHDYPVAMCKWSHDKKKDPVDGRKARKLVCMRQQDFMELIGKLVAEGIW